MSGLWPICRDLPANRIRAIRQEQEEPCDRNLYHSDTIGSDTTYNLLAAFPIEALSLLPRIPNLCLVTSPRNW